MIREEEVLQSILEIIDFNYPLPQQKQHVYRGKTIFFERVFFKTLSHVCQECLVNDDMYSFTKGLPDQIYITKHIPNLQIKQTHWEKVNAETGFDDLESRRVWAKLVLEFTNHKLDLANKITLPETIHFSLIQTTLLILFCYFYYFNREYITLNAEPRSFYLQEKESITWSLFEPGVISEFISPLRKITVFNRFDERDLAQFFKLSGNSLKSLRWILQPIYREWFQPLRQSIIMLDAQDMLSNPRFTSDSFKIEQLREPHEHVEESKSLSSEAAYLSLPHLKEVHQLDNFQNFQQKQRESDWEKLYFEKVLEVQDLRQKLMKKTEGVSDSEFLGIFEEILRLPRQFEMSFSELLPRRGRNTNIHEWIALERTMLSLRSLFLSSGYVTFGQISEIISMKTVTWPYAIDNRFAIPDPSIKYNRWKITRRGVKKNEVIILPALVQPY